MKNFVRSGFAAGLVVISGAASAADLPVKAAPVVIPQYNWTGLYIGAQLGDAIGHGAFTDSLAGGGLGSGQWDSFMGGGQMGYNYQVGIIVMGVEAMVGGFSGNSGTWPGNLGGDVIRSTSEGDWMTTVAGRIGISTPSADHWLFYAKGGGGWVEIDNTISDLSTGLSASTSGLHGGWLAGVGIEWAFASNWSLRIEYDYIALESYSVTSPFAAGDMLNVSNNSVQTVTFGINYLFSRGS